MQRKPHLNLIWPSWWQSAAIRVRTQASRGMVRHSGTPRSAPSAHRERCNDTSGTHRRSFENATMTLQERIVDPSGTSQHARLAPMRGFEASDQALNFSNLTLKPSNTTDISLEILDKGKTIGRETGFQRQAQVNSQPYSDSMARLRIARLHDAPSYRAPCRRRTRRE